MSINISSHHLLDHPFYRAWEDGSVEVQRLQDYASQYFRHVQAFPRYISAIHSQVESLEDRQVLLENLCDEEQGAENHPELWARFCDSLGMNRDTFLNADLTDASQKLISGFFSLCRSSAAEGLGALYAYESQVPEIAKFKLESLKKFYVAPEQWANLKFFEVHQKADIYHTQALEKVIAKLTPAEQKLAEQSAQRAAKFLWEFLDAMSAQSYPTAA